MMHRPQAVSSPLLCRNMDRSEALDLRERANAILWVKSQMARHGITPEALEAAGCFPKSNVAQAMQATQVCYRDAQGHTWDGKGNVPDWLQRAVNAGQSVEHFRVLDALAEKVPSPTD
ncbi:H-NS family nucleoid-associated regulatory protein [Cupriavidus necator]